MVKRENRFLSTHCGYRPTIRAVASRCPQQTPLLCTNDVAFVSSKNWNWNLETGTRKFWTKDLIENFIIHFDWFDQILDIRFQSNTVMKNWWLINQFSLKWWVFDLLYRFFNTIPEFYPQSCVIRATCFQGSIFFFLNLLIFPKDLKLWIKSTIGKSIFWAQLVLKIDHSKNKRH